MALLCVGGGVARADPIFIARRLCILASEDVGLADPQAIVQAASAAQIVQLIGLPEGLYPLSQATVYLAQAPLTHAAGVLCFPILARGGEVVIMAKPDVGRFLELIERHRVTHTFLPPTLIYMILGHAALDSTDLSSLQCFWYGAAPMSTARLAEALDRIGPMAQLFGQSEAPMMISTMSPADHRHPDGSLAEERFASAGRPSPLR